MYRRYFLKQAGMLAGGALLAPRLLSAASPSPSASADLPRWYGFNLTELFSGNHPGPFQETDFEMMKEWGFNFVRIPMSYWNWSKPDPDHWMEIDESVFKWMDQVVDLGKQYGIHVCLNLHRIPGYCINDGDKEPYQLFGKDVEGRQKSLTAAMYHWSYIAQRYSSVAPDKVSFDLINEPPYMQPELYNQVVTALSNAIHSIDPHRQIIADGISVGTAPDPLLSKDIIQSTRGYAPMNVTHYQASWVRGMDTLPTWPMKLDDGQVWDKARLAQHFEPWRALVKDGYRIHVGEWGVYSHTPHPVALAFMRDQLSLWKEWGWGWALWNFRGDFGILDSNRKDVQYQAYKGHQLDSEMLSVLVDGMIKG